jgi:hypothetical protein
MSSIKLEFQYMTYAAKPKPVNPKERMPANRGELNRLNGLIGKDLPRRIGPEAQRKKALPSESVSAVA